MKKSAKVILEIVYDEDVMGHPEGWNWPSLLNLDDGEDCKVLRSDIVPSDSERIVVLNDGETFSSVSGCKIHQIPIGMDSEEIEEYIKDNDVFQELF